jgi:hypothetical protein
LDLMSLFHTLRLLLLGNKLGLCHHFPILLALWDHCYQRIMDVKATFVRTEHLQHILNPPLYEKYCTGMYRTVTLCTSEGLNKSICQAWLNTSQPLLPVDTCTRSRTPVWRLMPDYWTCWTSVRADYRDCTVLKKIKLIFRKIMRIICDS